MSVLIFTTLSGSVYVLEPLAGTVSQHRLTRVSNHDVQGAEGESCWTVEGWELLPSPDQGNVFAPPELHKPRVRFHVVGRSPLTTTPLKALLFDGDDVLDAFVGS